MRRGVLVLGVAMIIGALAVPAMGGGRPLSAELAGSNEVPPSGSAATGTAHVTLNQGQGEVCVQIESGDFESMVLAAHIHAAPAGVNGGVVVPLTITTDGEVDGCFDADADRIKAIRQNPEGYYINIHTVDVPSGEIRGQLSK